MNDPNIKYQCQQPSNGSTCLTSYCRFVVVGSYVTVHDTTNNNQPHPAILQGAAMVDAYNLWGGLDKSSTRHHLRHPVLANRAVYMDTSPYMWFQSVRGSDILFTLGTLNVNHVAHDNEWMYNPYE